LERITHYYASHAGVPMPFLKTNFLRRILRSLPKHKNPTMAAIEPEQTAIYGLLINKSNGIYNRGVGFLDPMKSCPNSVN
jgi:hypothetical protein